jgi:hypothetical protein
MELKSIYRREKTMIKKFRLSIELTSDVDESVQGIEDREERVCTREIVKCLSENPGLLNMYYKTIEVQSWMFDYMEEHERHRVIEEEGQIWEKLLKIVPPDAVDYLKELIDGGSDEKDENDKFIIDKRWQLIFNRLGSAKITGWDFEEMGIDEKLTSPWFPGNNLIA